MYRILTHGTALYCQVGAESFRATVDMSPTQQHQYVELLFPYSMVLFC